MPRSKASPDPEIAQAFLVKLTPNQVVGYNLAAARQWKGWTQDEFAEALEPHLGVRWSAATVSQAERSVAGRFVRNFNADEIVAFARTYELPIGWFFLPPPPFEHNGVAVKLDVPDEDFGEALGELVDLVFGDEHTQALLLMRLQAFLQQSGYAYPLTDVQERIASLVRGKIEAVVAHAFSELGDWQTMLRSLANHLEDLEARAARAVDHEMGIEAPPDTGASAKKQRRSRSTGTRRTPKRE